MIKYDDNNCQGEECSTQILNIDACKYHLKGMYIMAKKLLQSSCGYEFCDTF